MNETPDFLDELIGEGMTEDPQFSALVDAAARRREILRSFGRRREALGISQRTLAARMRTQQPAIARLEGGESDPKLSTLERYAAALGLDVDITLVAHQPNSGGRGGRSANQAPPESGQRAEKLAASLAPLVKR